jgi:hypothetical protein
VPPGFGHCPTTYIAHRKPYVMAVTPRMAMKRPTQDEARPIAANASKATRKAD